MQNFTKPFIQDLRKKYLAVNASRLTRCNDSLSNAEQDFLTLIPLLFHVNDEQFPGYISNDVPASIPQYSAGKKVVDAGKRMIDKSFKIHNKMKLSLSIQGVYIINAKGMTAHNSSQGIEICICVDTRVDDKGWDLLQQKSGLIEQWATNKGFKAQCRLFDAHNWHVTSANSIKSKTSNAVSPKIQRPLNERFNSLLHLDEFYYSSLLLAGKYPVWWFIPTEDFDESQTCIQTITDENWIDESEFIDFGPLSNIEENVFYKSVITQFIHELNTPYYLILNIILAEVYCQNFHLAHYISTKLKYLLHQGETDINKLDPSLLILEMLETYLANKGDAKRLELVRRCFYVQAKEFKDELIKIRQSDWHKKSTATLVKNWQWDKEFIRHLEMRSDWEIQYILQQDNILHYALNQSLDFYQKLIQSSHALIRDKKLLKHLNCKFDISFNAEHGKVKPVIQSVSSIPLLQKQLTIIPIKLKNKKELLNLYRGSVTTASCKKVKPIKSSSSLIELLCWGYFNGILKESTAIYAYSNNPILSDRFIRKVIRFLSQHFKKPLIGQISLQDLSKPARVKNIVLFVNLGIDPLKNYTENGQELATSKIDAFNFSARHINIVSSFQWVIVNSWNEAIVNHSSNGTDTVIDFLIDYLTLLMTSPDNLLPKISIYSAEGGRELLVHQRVEEVFEDMFTYFIGHINNNTLASARYVMIMENKPIIFYFKHSTPQNLKITDTKAMLSLFSAPHSEQQCVKFGPAFLKHTLFPCIFNSSMMGRIHLYYHHDESNNKASISIIDERGSLFHDVVYTENLSSLLQSYLFFIQNSIQRVQIYHQQVVENSSLETISPVNFNSQEVNDNIRFYKLELDKDEVYNCSQVDLPEDSILNYYNIRVSIEPHENKKSEINVYCNDEEFSSNEHGDNIFATLSQYLLNQQAQKKDSSSNRSFFITDLNVTEEFLLLKNPLDAQTFHYLNSKKLLESRISNFINR